jgi:bis(5'-nucleosidyl)-tetraphosphatase
MEKSCGVVLLNSNKVLLLQHPDTATNGHWDFPKGHVEKGEDEIQTALRELKEETGIGNVKIMEDFHHLISYNLLKEGKIISKEVVFFLGITNQEKVSISSEHQNFVWLQYESAYERLTYENAKKTLKKAFVFIKTDRYKTFIYTDIS